VGFADAAKQEDVIISWNDKDDLVGSVSGISWNDKDDLVGSVSGICRNA
jgi:hypothetical protein